MSTGVLYHALVVRGDHYVATDFMEGTVAFTIEPQEASRRCVALGSAEVIRKGQVDRTFFALPIGSRQVMLQAHVPRLKFEACGGWRQAESGFAQPRRTYSKSLERYVLELLRSTTVLDVAKRLGVSWEVVKDIQKR